MGTCNGVLSSCALGGYAMETRSVAFPHQVYELPQLSPVRCHLGKSIVYDTVTNASWVVDIRTHGIVSVIERLLSDPWPPSVEVGREVPEATVELDCLVSLDYAPHAPIIGCLISGLGVF
jgi:lipase ATG15